MMKSAKTRPTAPGLVAPYAYLFKGEIDQDDLYYEKYLPFVDETLEQPQRWWSVPNYGTGPGSGRKYYEFGLRAAAAYMIALAHEGTTNLVPLGGIFDGITKVDNDHPDEDYGPQLAGYGFGSYLQRLLWLFTKEVSPADLVRDVEDQIARLPAGCYEPYSPKHAA